MKLYHDTGRSEGRKIVAGGFPDGSVVLLTDRPRGEDDGVVAAWSLEYEIPDGDPSLAEWALAPGGWREFSVPADVANRYAPPKVSEGSDWRFLFEGSSSVTVTRAGAASKFEDGAEAKRFVEPGDRVRFSGSDRVPPGGAD